MSEHDSSGEHNKREKGMKFYLDLGPVFGYFFRKKDPNRPTNFNIRMMHGINKVSIIMFLLSIVYFIIKIMLR